MVDKYIVGFVLSLMYLFVAKLKNGKLVNSLSIALAVFLSFTFAQNMSGGFDFKLSFDIRKFVFFVSLLNVVYSVYIFKKKVSNVVSFFSSGILFCFFYIVEENFLLTLIILDLSFLLLLGLKINLGEKFKNINALLKREMIGVLAYFAMFAVFFQGGHNTTENIQLNYPIEMLAFICSVLFLKLFYELYLFRFSIVPSLSDHKKIFNFSILGPELIYQILSTFYMSKMFKIFFNALPPKYQSKFIGLVGIVIVVSMVVELIKSFNSNSMALFINNIISVKKLTLLYIICISEEMAEVYPTFFVTFLLFVFSILAVEFFRNRKHGAEIVVISVLLLLIAYLILPSLNGTYLMRNLLEGRQYILMISIVLPNILLSFQAVKLISNVSSTLGYWHKLNEKVQS